MIIPVVYHYVLFVFMIVTFLVEGFFDLRGKRFSERIRWIPYKAIEFALLLIALVYYILARVNVEEGVIVLRIFFGVILAVGMGAVIVEGVFGVYERFFEE